jgi:cobalt-zinc-cadmium efflux system outer membrane protein
MRVSIFSFTAVGIYALLTANVANAQEPMPMPGQMDRQHMQHEHANIQPVAPVYPRLRRAQENPSATLFTLADAQRIAAESNPTMRQAAAEIRAAQARTKQAALYPNPTIGYTGDEIRGGSVGGGKQGFFLEQKIVTGGKLARARDVSSREVRLAEIEAEEQKMRVESAVKIAYYRTLAAQEILDLRRDLAGIGKDYATTLRQLLNSGQADETEVLDAELDTQRLGLYARMQENSLREAWSCLAAILGRGDLPLATVAGDLERDWPDLEEQQTADNIATQSPAVRIADTASARAVAEIARAKRQYIPDLQLRGGMEYNNDQLGSVQRAKGWEGIAEVAVQLPLFNRNQGNVSAAAAYLDRAKLEQQRVALALRERAATAIEQYRNAKLTASVYRDELLPLAKKSYTLMVQKYGSMLASYPRVIHSQRKLFELETEYVQVLEGVWTTGTALSSYLLTDGLEGPARPGEMDLPMREMNLPLPDRGISPVGSMLNSAPRN